MINTKEEYTNTLNERNRLRNLFSSCNSLNEYDKLHNNVVKLSNQIDEYRKKNNL